MTNIIDTLILSCSNFFTSALTAVTGLGGGTILISIMPLFLPTIAIVPVHATTQLASNASRAWFGRKELRYDFFKPFLIGAFFGIIVFGCAIQYIRLTLIPLFIALYILITQWSNTVNRWLKNIENFYLVGFLQMGLGLFVGTPGPLAISLLNKKYVDTHTVVSVAALMMVFLHVIKIIIYSIRGFDFFAYWQLIIYLIIMAILGSWVGTKLRHLISARWLPKALPWLLSAVALYIILGYVKQLFFNPI